MIYTSLKKVIMLAKLSYDVAPSTIMPPQSEGLGYPVCDTPVTINAI